MKQVPLPVDLDFLQTRRRVSIAGWGMLAAGVLACALQIIDYRRASAEVDARTAAVLSAREAARRSQPVAMAEGNPVSAEEAKAVLGVAERLNADWGGMLGGVAGAQGEGVTWLSLQADQARGRLAVAGQARSLAEMFEFVARLGAVQGIRDAQLANYEWVQVDSGDAVRFTVNAKWSGRP
ncbi:hypothetical protein U5817_18575 [Aromatoleum evansii]|uniref:PilN domain-containing protein n=1 Tax=Aromatoleum evansii TaxID=59406 RepID=A0ABZ1AH43_AROEV|nr:hypothetical protein U5817_18575 [Aromatoleum evansii]